MGEKIIQFGFMVEFALPLQRFFKPASDLL